MKHVSWLAGWLISRWILPRRSVRVVVLIGWLSVEYSSIRISGYKEGSLQSYWWRSEGSATTEGSCAKERERDMHTRLDA